MLELCALGDNPVAALFAARELGGIAYVSDDEDRPFRTLVRVAGVDASALSACSDLGLYRVEPRQILRHDMTWSVGDATPGAVAIYGMVRRGGLSHQECDAHWRDVHAPLALEHHPVMWDYVQLNVVATLEGPEFDGFAFCGFPSLEDLRERFFATPEGKVAIRSDIGRFADPRRSARRVLATEWIFGPETSQGATSQPV